MTIKKKLKCSKEVQRITHDIALKIGYSEINGDLLLTFADLRRISTSMKDRFKRLRTAGCTTFLPAYTHDGYMHFDVTAPAESPGPPDQTKYNGGADDNLQHAHDNWETKAKDILYGFHEKNQPGLHPELDDAETNENDTTCCGSGASSLKLHSHVGAPAAVWIDGQPLPPVPSDPAKDNESVVMGQRGAVRARRSPCKYQLIRAGRKRIFGVLEPDVQAAAAGMEVEIVDGRPRTIMIATHLAVQMLLFDSNPCDEQND